MSKIIILIEPADGHFNPFVPIIKSLVSRGHEILCITGSRFKDKVELLDAHFSPLPPQWDPGEQEAYDFFPELKNKKGLAQIKFYLKHIMYDQVPDVLVSLQAVMRTFPADVVLCDTFMVAGNWLGELDGIPSVRLSVLPLSLPAKDMAPFGLGLLPGNSITTKLRNNLLNLLFEKLLFKDVQTHVNNIRKKVGLADFDKSFFIKGYEIPDLVLHTSTPLFEYSRNTIADNFRYIGAVLVAANAEYNMPDWWSKLDKSLPVILLTQGTVAKDADELIRPAIEALTDEPVNVIIVSVESGALHKLPENMHAEAYIPFGNLLPFVDIMISNGGLGGVQNALAHGVPVIIAGATEDKMEVAARVEYSGAGINLRTESPLALDIKNAVQRILLQPEFKSNATELQVDYTGYDAVKLAVEAVEELIAK